MYKRFHWGGGGLYGLPVYLGTCSDLIISLYSSYSVQNLIPANNKNHWGIWHPVSASSMYIYSYVKKCLDFRVDFALLMNRQHEMTAIWIISWLMMQSRAD